MSDRTGGVTVALIGAGMRGMGYARRAVEEGAARIVAIAEPRAEAREAAAREFGVAAEDLFDDWAAFADA